MFGIPNMFRTCEKPKKIKIKVDIAKQIEANLNQPKVEWKILSPIMPEKIAAKIIIKYVRNIVNIPVSWSLSPHTAVIYGVKYVVNVNII